MSERLPEPDRLPYPRVVALLFAVLALFGLAVFISSRIQRAATEVPPPSPEKMAAGKQRLLERAAELRRQRLIDLAG